jgi:nucleoprotein TPR
VIGHADSLKANESLRTQLSAIQDSSRGNAAAAETAQAKLATSEGSWRLQKVALEKEVADLGAR